MYSVNNVPLMGMCSQHIFNPQEMHSVPLQDFFSKKDVIITPAHVEAVVDKACDCLEHQGEVLSRGQSAD